MDRISDLPDDLLHRILVFLHSTRAAARTSLLSRRWRRVWTQLPELVLRSSYALGSASFANSIDAAIAAHTAQVVERLEIIMPTDHRYVSVRGIAPWLRFASQRLVGTLELRVQCQPTPKSYNQEEDEVDFPVCDRATGIKLFLGGHWPCLQPAAGTFAALIDLVIFQTSMEARALEALVSSQCPRLKNLILRVNLVAASDVTLRSDSLILLNFGIFQSRRIEIIAPRMEELHVSWHVDALTISTPKLAVFYLEGRRSDPCHHQ